jgi:hypothetical protein
LYYPPAGRDCRDFEKKSRLVVRSIALAGAGTGVLSYLSITYAPAFLRFSFLDGPVARTVPDLSGQQANNATAVTIVPGIIFGALVAFANWKFGLRDKFRLAVIVLFTTASWTLATNTTVLTYLQIDKYASAPGTPHQKDGDTGAGANSGHTNGTSDADAKSSTGPDWLTRHHIPFGAALSGLVGGCIGGFGTLLGVGIVNGRMRRIEKLLPILIAATVIGSLVEFVDYSDPYATVGLILLFFCWQAAVAGMIARVLFIAETERQMGQ